MLNWTNEGYLTFKVEHANSTDNASAGVPPELEAIPRASKSFVLLNEDLYLTYLRESDDALGNVVTKRTLWRLHAARVAASG